MVNDQYKYLHRCVQLAKRGGKFVRSNPQVGAVLVHTDRIIGEGYHEIYGGNHAEVNAIESVAEKDKQLISNSTLYVSLEPCNHRGKTGPCTQLIIEHKIPHVVIGKKDPNENVESNGVEKLRSAGINVDIVDHQTSDQLIRPFTKGSLRNIPYIILKYAQSKDNYMGQDGLQVSISNKYTQHLVHKWRTEIDGIMVGTQTVLTDNPKLTNRLANGESPIRIIPDKHHKINDSYHVRSDGNETWFYKDSIDLENLMSDLYKKGIYRIMIEGGATLLKSFIAANLWHEARVITSDKLLHKGIKAPMVKGKLISTQSVSTDTIRVVYAA